MWSSAWGLDLVTNVIAIISMILGICGLCYTFWPKKKPVEPEKPTSILFNEAIKIMGESDYYKHNNNREMWEKMGVTQESFCRNQLDDSIKRKRVSLWGRKVFSSNNDLQKIDAEEYKRFYLDKENNLLSVLDEITYTDLSVYKNELLSLIETLKLAL